VDLEHDLAAHIQATERDGSALESSTTGLTELIHEAVLMPASSILTSFPGLVRDYSENTGKMVVFEVTGGEIEIDRRILDALKDPLIHLVYNSIDHGIEYPDIRQIAGKPATGRVRIRIQTHTGGRVTIEVEDNGKGIDGAKIRTSALKAGLITKEESAKINDEEAIWLIFRSGFSTNPVVTDISGRGLGLAIVEDTITRLGGHVTIASRVNKGTRVTLDVPVQLVTFRGVVVRSGTQSYVLPMQQVQQVLRVRPDTLGGKEGRAAIFGENELTGIYPLSELLGETHQSHKGADEPVCLVILAYGAGRIACSVDEIVRVQEIVVRPLGTQLRRVKRISGGAILGDGTLALVLDPPELIQEAFRRGCPITPAEPVHEHPRQILVVEDSVTSRAYLQSLLEREGYRVLTAENGREAFAKVKAERPDLVISDVDMPLMNGFLFAEKIRKDKRFVTLPVILVTSLDSVKDRQQGIGAGVDAYLVKSSFENGVLLKTVRDLLSAGRRTDADSESIPDSPKT
jgi:two-component system chemotaxis sensor kinase CheA